MRKLALFAVLLMSCKSTPQRTETEGAGQQPSSLAQTPATQAGTPPGAAPNAGSQPPAPVQPAATAQEPPPAPKPGIDVSIIDRSVSPCTDFYRFACGKWIDSTPIPPDRARWTRSFDEILDRNQYVLRDVLEKDLASDADPFARKVHDYYATCMDEDKAETASMQVLRDAFQRIDGVKDKKALARAVASLHRGGARALFVFGARADFKNPNQVVGFADQGGLGLPNKDYYFRDDKKSADLRNLYVDHVGKMLQLAGEAPDAASADAKKVMDLETALAKSSLGPIERRNPDKLYHRIERKGLMAAAPGFEWKAYFDGIGLPKVTTINVTVPDFFKALDATLRKSDLPTLKTYLRWHFLEFSADMLGKDFVNERFRFNQALTGAKQILPRWKRCVEFTDRAMGEAVGRSFVAATGGEKGKAVAKEMIVSIEQAFERDLGTLTWMDDEGKKASLYKLHKIFNKVDYPDKWRDYTKMEVGTESPLANHLAAARFESKRQLDKIGKPLDRAEWGMTPPTVNAYYNGSLNEMVFPAGIMQLPFFSPDAPVDSNYGGLGMVMGHELTHGFDDQGRKFDGDGSLHEWWTSKTTKEFEERAACVAKQYDGYVAVDDVHLQGKLTLGENLGDIGGLKLMLSALRERRQGMQPTNVGGFDDDQQAFIAFAQVWCTNARPEQLRTQALTNPHSTSQWRVNGPVTDNPDFAKAFSCPAGSPLAPEPRCQVW
jgi:endothelin-converting enzyme/putative endopeptidase